MTENSNPSYPDPAISPALQFFIRPGVGTTLLVLAGLSFMMVCMTLPLVGPAGAATPWAQRNFAAFLGILLLTLALAGLALGSKLLRRKRDGSPFPRAASALCGACLFLLVALLAGLLKI